MKKILLSAVFAVPFLMNAQITLISEDFESYSDGDVLTDVGGDNGWREWGADFGSASAGYSSLASSAYAANGSMSGRSVSNETVDSDGIFAWNNINAGQYMIKMNLYVPEGSAGGYIGIGDNMMDINETYSSMYYIISGDTLLLVSDGAAYIAQAPLTPGAWDAVDLMVDLDANTSDIMVNGVSVGTGTAGNGNMAINGLGAFDLWGTGINVFADPVEYNPGEFFYDDLEVVDIGCSAIMISNHGGRQLDGSRSPFDQVKAISDAVGDKLEIILDGGVRRGTHVLKALAAGAKACSFGKMFLFSLAAGGQEGVEKLLQNMHDEIDRNMVLMGCKNLKELNSSKLVYRNRG